MTSSFDLLKYVNQREILRFELDNLIYGTIELRDKKYIYIHNKIGGVQITKYIGEYSDVLYEMIIENNKISKKLKKEIRAIDKKLEELGYVDSEMNKAVALSIDFAKRNLVNTIYDQAILEGVATTFLDTENIIEGGKINNMSAIDIMKVVNLKHAWDFILDKDVINCDTDFNLLSNINKLVEEGFYYTAGEIRVTNVKIGGTTWTPKIPDKNTIEENIKRIIKSSKSNIEKAIDLLLYTTREQIFIDGNKRTSVIFSNHFLISKGLGMIVIPSESVEEYKKLLLEYYETNKSVKISKFLKDKCYIKLKK